MSQLIIGHVSENSAKIWVRGVANNESTTTLTAHITLKSDFQNITQNLTIYKHDNFIGVFEFTDLNTADSGFFRMMYMVEVVFKDIAKVPIGGYGRGSFNTVPRVKYPVNFLIGCNFLQRNADDAKRVFKNLSNIRKVDRPSFMIHAGNQIYVDAPAHTQPIQADLYNKKYNEAWKQREAAEFLGRIANYSAINDHELYFKYAKDTEYDFKPASYYLMEALPAYRNYQHLKNPHTYETSKLYYHYNYAGNAFFVMDVRLERYQFGKRQMISNEQMEAFKSWLLANKDQPKFVVTPVPFAAIKETYFSEYWSSEIYLQQKEEILYFLKVNNIGKLVFLTGQGNAALHSTITIKKGIDEPLVVHELMCGALSHYEAALCNYDDFVWYQRSRTAELDYEYKVESGNGEKDPAVMSISFENDLISYKAYSTRYAMDEDEVPPVILSGSIKLR
jgi:phosphodiesterase/alkaline phosphatase D-like protein